VDTTEILLRLGAAIATGIFLGLEREHRGRAAGLRTTLLVCTAAAVAMILSEQFFSGSAVPGALPPGWRPDPARLAVGVLTGMGFIGSGVVLHKGNRIEGLTTAALLWFTTMLGLCFGSGEYRLGACGLGIAALALLVLPRLERHVHTISEARLSVTTSLAGTGPEGLAEILEQAGVSPIETDIAQDLVAGTRTVGFSVRFRRGHPIAIPEKITAAVAGAVGVRSVSWIQ
jgi:putative Mg2+ transporter-C (MgtC) family protein